MSLGVAIALLGTAGLLGLIGATAKKAQAQEPEPDIPVGEITNDDILTVID